MLLSERIALKIFYASLLLFILLVFGPGAGSAHAQSQCQTALVAQNILVLHAFECSVPIFELTDLQQDAPYWTKVQYLFCFDPCKFYIVNV
jgi:hypothetical protein